jgi:hypothetical protein
MEEPLRQGGNDLSQIIGRLLKDSL